MSNGSLRVKLDERVAVVAPVSPPERRVSAPRSPKGRASGCRPAALRAAVAVAVVVASLVALGAAYLLYRTSALAGEGLERRAVDNATGLVRWERALGLDWERAAQRSWLARGVPGAMLAGFYALAYWPFVATALAASWLRARPGFRRLRNGLMISGAVGLLVILAVPMAPPRLLDGYEDQIASAGLGSIAHPSSLFNPYAAFPSFHVAWTTLAALALLTVALGHGWRAVIVVVPLLMAVAVVTTGNHFVLDVVAGWLLAVVGWGLAPAMERQFDAHRARSAAKRRR